MWQRCGQNLLCKIAYPLSLPHPNQVANSSREDLGNKRCRAKCCTGFLGDNVVFTRHVHHLSQVSKGMSIQSSSQFGFLTYYFAYRDDFWKGLEALMQHVKKSENMPVGAMVGAITWALEIVRHGQKKKEAIVIMRAAPKCLPEETEKLKALLAALE